MKTLIMVLSLASPFLHATEAQDNKPTSRTPTLEEFVDQLKRQQQSTGQCDRVSSATAADGKLLYLINARGEVQAVFGCQ